MDDDTFDPRSWLRPPQTTAKVQPDNPQPGDSSNPPPTPSPSEGSDILPEAWRGIGGEFSPLQPQSVAANPEPPAETSRRGTILPLILSLAILIGGASAAWLTRIQPAPQPAQPQIAAALEAKPAPGVELRRVVLASTRDIAEALVAAGASPHDSQAAAQEAARVLTAPGEIQTMIELMPSAGEHILQRLQASYSDGSGAVITRNSDGQFSGTRVAAELTKRVKVLRGELDTDSFYSSAVAAGLVDTLIPEFINAFSFDFNLASEVTPGDTFEVAYEQSIDASGNSVGQPRLLFGSLTTKTKSLALYRFQAPGGEVGWYDGNGGSTKRGLMRTPVDGARITSNFGMRFHPVLHYTRLHAGVDFGVPVGTPVYAAADGNVIGATPTSCGGNMAVLQHDNGWVTRYFHLSHYAPGLHSGQRVKQGETIGLSGTTGTCTTGPHLHYELRINGEPVDPLSVPMDDKQKKTIEGPAKQSFIAQRNRVDVARAQQASNR